ncbi:hypothetical protein BVRB_032750, partial [Beta vulgaris subsp. vulgaris]
MAKEAARKSKPVAISSEEESESEEDSESSDESELSEDEKATANPLPKPNSSKSASRRKESQPSQSKGTKVDAGLTLKFEKVGVSSTTESFADQAPAAKTATSGNNNNDFGQFGDFFGAESKPASSASTSNDKDFIMSLFQSTPASQPDPSAANAQGLVHSGPYMQAPTMAQYGQISPQMPYQMMQGMPPTSAYPSGPASAMPYTTAPNYPSNAPMMNSFGPNAPEMTAQYPPMINMGP